MLFGIHPATAVGTDLLYAAATKTAGSLVHGFARSVEWQVVWRLATGSVPATMITLALLSFLNLESQAARSLITIVLCGALLMTAGVLIFRGTIVHWCQERGRNRARHHRIRARAEWRPHRAAGPNDGDSSQFDYQVRGPASASSCR